MTLINLTSDDLTANDMGVLSSAQRRVVQMQRVRWLLGMVLSVLIALSVVGGFAYQRIDPTFANRGQLFLWAAVCCFWLWLFRGAWQQWGRAGSDLQEGTVTTIEGVVAHDLRLGVGMVPQLQYGIRVGEQTFVLPKKVFFQFANGHPYRLTITPHAHVLLGAVPLAAPLPVGSPAVTHPSAVPPLLDPLTEREQQILTLIADGLSNQEIALRTSLSVNTIKMYSSTLYQKLGVQRRTEAVARARQLGLL